MGNCQATETATVVIQHSGINGKMERLYWAVSANQVMGSNPGHYVALVFDSPAPPNGPPVKRLKLLRPDDTLHLGHVYRLVTFQDVLTEFATKKSVKLGKLLKESGVISIDTTKKESNAGGSHSQSQQDTTHFPLPKMMKDYLYCKDLQDPIANEKILESKNPKELEQLNRKKTEEVNDGISSGLSLSNGSRTCLSRHHRQWKPALQSIVELGN